MRLAIACAVIALSASACAAPPPPPAPEPPPSTAVRDSLKSAMDMIASNITRAAEQVPEARYSYRATPDVRTMGQLFGHVADASYAMCGTVSGTAAPAESVETTKKTKVEIQQALTDAFAFCGRAFDTVNDSTGGAAVTLFETINTTKLGALAFNNAHNMEHYGNIVTYMRLNKMVPPSSQQ